MMITRRWGAAFILLVLAQTQLVACRIQKKAVVQKSSSTVSNCRLPADQSGSLLAHWKIGPVPLAFWTDGDDAIDPAQEFDRGEMAQQLAAMDTWNQFFASRGGKVFDYGISTEPNRTPAAVPLAGACPERIVTGSGFSGRVAVHKVSSNWNTGGLENVIALTVICSEAGTPFKGIHSAAIKFNYEDFGPAGGSKPAPDWQSIALHEQGHLLGLDHSCDDSGRAGMPRCAGAPAAYREALMYPDMMVSGKGLVRRFVDDNTAGRVNCLYGI